MDVLFFCLNSILSEFIIKKTAAIKPIITKPKTKIIKNETFFLMY